MPALRETRPERPRQFSLAWLIFWTVICAAGAAIVRLFVERGETGIDYLVIACALAIWLGVTWLAIWRRVFSKRRWAKVRAHRRELEDWSRQRLQQRETTAQGPPESHNP